jgi:hypothetical protein
MVFGVFKVCDDPPHTILDIRLYQIEAQSTDVISTGLACMQQKCSNVRKS